MEGGTTFESTRRHSVKTSSRDEGTHVRMQEVRGHTGFRTASNSAAVSGSFKSLIMTCKLKKPANPNE